jgi:hypothetical protein
MIPRKPYLSSGVMAGLISISERIEAQTEAEAQAVLWVHRHRLHRSLSSDAPKPHDADSRLLGVPRALRTTRARGTEGEK